MRSNVLRVICALSLFAAASCGDASDEAGEDISLDSLGIDVPADYAGGRFVRVKGTLTKGAAKKGSMTGRDLYHGYTLTASRGQSLELRGLSGNMGLTALYGPQKADGTWGSELVKRWHFRAGDRTVPVVPYKAEKAGKYLVVIGLPQRDVTTPSPYAVTFCNGTCKADTCVEQANENGANAHNFINAIEAEVAGAIPSTIAAGSCGEQPRSCPSTTRRVCARIIGAAEPTTYSNICKARVALRDALGDKLALKMLFAEPGACPN